ncbi:hypothetical protein G6F31_021231 [Rhizopus arrhizus]|nr:hypothetical protein G6F31_021231 [Rhizopus arrhizus]
MKRGPPSRFPGRAAGPVPPCRLPTAGPCIRPWPTACCRSLKSGSWPSWHLPAPTTSAAAISKRRTASSGDRPLGKAATTGRGFSTG